MNIQWYPGHMTKTRRQMEEDIRRVDLVAEVVDARIPLSSRNPDIDAIAGGKPRLILFNRTDQADPKETAAWMALYQRDGLGVLETDAKSGKGVSRFSATVREVLKDKIEAWKAKGQVGRPVRVMVVGIPNVGKSTFINKVAGRKTAKAADKPGVTRGKQWISIDAGMDLLDTPGILWPRFEDETTGLHLAFTGAVKDEILDTETLGCRLMALLAQRYPDALRTAYKLPELPQRQGEENDTAYGYRILEAAAVRRGMKISGGEADTERMARVLLDEFRAGRLGRFTLEPAEEGGHG